MIKVDPKTCEHKSKSIVMPKGKVAICNNCGAVFNVEDGKQIKSPTAS